VLPIPQIGYYSMSSNRPKYARWNPKAGSLKTAASIDGCDDNDSYTGNWEVTNIPTASKVRKNDSESGVTQNVGVGVWKDANGKIKASQTGTSYSRGGANGDGSGAKVVNRGNVYGNGTKNAVLSYTQNTSGDAYIETAQRVGDYDN